MNGRLLAVMIAVFMSLLPACGTFIPEVGGEGQPCYGNGGCEGGLVCDASEICVRPGADGDMDFTGDEDDVDADGDAVDRDDADEPATDGDVTPDGDRPDGDEADGDEEEACVCGPSVTDCCDGCFWTTDACTPEDEHAQGGHCDTGDCLIDACENGWHVAVGQLVCEEDLADGDDGDGDLDELDSDEEIVTDGDEEIQPDGDEIDEPEVDPDPDEVETTEIETDEASDGDVDGEGATRHLKIGIFAPTATGVSSAKPYQAKMTWHKTVIRRNAK